MDDQPTGSCPTCSRREPRTPQLCDVCRSRLRAWLFDLTDLHTQLAEGDPSVRDYRGTRVVVDDDNKPIDEVPHYDHVSNVLPAGGGPSGFRIGPITGSKTRRLPINEDAADLTGPVRSAGVAVLDEDATGYESVATVLDFWVTDWRSLRGAGERRPSATVPELARWLLDRLDDACDNAPSIAEFYAVIGRTRRALLGQLGQFDIPDYKRFTPCPRCFSLTLVHHNGSQFVECGTCPAVLSFLEYDEHTRSLSAEHEQLRRVKVAKVKAVRRLVAAMRAAGWRHGVDYAESERDSDGAPWHEGYRIHRWRRGEEGIEFWTYLDPPRPYQAIWYSPDHEEPGLLGVSVSTDWVAANGIPALQRLARAAGLLTPIKQETAA